MISSIRPPEPEPPRWLFKSSEAYLEAKNAWRKREDERIDGLNTHLAFMTTLCIVMVGCVASIAGYVLYEIGSWRLVVGIVLSVGLFWALFTEVKKRI